MKKLLTVILLMMSLGSYAATEQNAANNVDLDGLSSEQIAYLAQQADKMKTESSSTSEVVRKEAEAWGELGTNMGKAMVGAAHELGVAANDFATTPLGKVVVAIVAYKLIGNEIVGIVVGVLIMMFGYSTALWIFLTNRWSERKYEYIPTFRGLFNRKHVVYHDTSDEVVQVKLWVGLIILVLTTAVSCATIF